MQISIENSVLEKHPEAEIGYLLAQVTVAKTDPYVEALKGTLLAMLQEKGINATNFAAHPQIAAWRTLYEGEFKVSPKTYRSSVEALLKRILTGKGVWNISSVVDLYNCCSALSLFPMGGYDVKKISGDIVIRYGKEGEKFLPLGDWRKVDVQPHQIIYADAERVLCWLWNHKDSAESCIDETTREVLFFIDSLGGNMEYALHQLAEGLKKIGGAPLKQGILNAKSPSAEVVA